MTYPHCYGFKKAGDYTKTTIPPQLGMDISAFECRLVSVRRKATSQNSSDRLCVCNSLGIACIEYHDNLKYNSNISL